MGMFKARVVNLAQTATDNPTKTIEQHYAELMAQEDPEKLALDVMSLVRRKGGISENNLARFTKTVHENSGNLEKLRFYITNFLLAGCGLGVLKRAN